MTHQSLVREQEEFVKGLFALYWSGETDVINGGHRKLPEDVRFAPLEVSHTSKADLCC